MKAELLQSIRDNLEAYERQILKVLEIYHYQKERYGVDYTIAIGATDEEVDFNSFSEILRKTDTFIPLAQTVSAVVFAFNDPEQGIKAASNMLHKFETQHFSKQIYLGIVNSQEIANPQQQVKKLFQTLFFCIDNDIANVPFDFQHMESISV